MGHAEGAIFSRLREQKQGPMHKIFRSLGILRDAILSPHHYTIRNHHMLRMKILNSVDRPRDIGNVAERASITIEEVNLALTTDLGYASG